MSRIEWLLPRSLLWYADASVKSCWCAHSTRTKGKAVTTDRPFAETKEQLGGYYIVDAKDLEAAIAIAARIPGARTGSIEVRAVASLPPR